MPSRLNQLMVRELKERFRGVDTCFFVDFTGLTGRKAAQLRAELRASCPGGRLSVVKTSLARRAFRELEGLAALSGESLEQCLTGPTAVAYGADDPVLLARTLAEWSRKEELLAFKGGVLAGRPLPAEAVAALAQIPPKPVLMGQVVGMIAAPLTSLLGVCQGLLRQIVGLADALAKQKAEAEGKES